MRTLYKCFVLLLTLVCWEVSFAKSSNPSSSRPSVTITISGAASSSTVCPGDSFTARANVSNISTSGLVYEWTTAIGSVNSQSILVTTSNTVTVVVNRPFSENKAYITLRVSKNGQVVDDVVKLLTVLPNTTPAPPSFISLIPDNPNFPSSSVVCQNSVATFSVPSVTGAFQYIWTANGRTTTTRSSSFSAFFSTVGTQTVSVRAVGCAGTSAARTVSITVITASQSPCNDNQFSRTTSPSVKSTVGTYPNPVDNGNLRIDVSEDYLLSSAQLIDQKTGRAVKLFTIKDQQSVVATGNLPKGAYLLKIHNQKGTLMRRIVVE